MSSALHPIEVKVLTSLKGGGGLDLKHMVESTGLQADQIRRAIEWLSSKRLVEVETSTVEKLVAAESDPPELALLERVEAMGGEATLGQLKGSFKTESEFSAAVGRARGAGWIVFETAGSTTTIRLADPEKSVALKELLTAVRGGAKLDDLPEPQKKLVPDLVRRGILRSEVIRTVKVKATPSGERAVATKPTGAQLDALTPSILASGSWRGKALRPIDVQAQAPRYYPGRRHPVRDFIREVREAYISMGFTELQGPSVQPAFWNFDALFIPQDHPGREMQDTFYLKGLNDRKMTRSGIVDNVASTHEDGWSTGSAGWGYRWQVEEARRLVLRTHNTVLTVKALSESREKETRVFAVSKVYRNENLDYKHLAEFHQMDGIIVGPGLNVRHLMGFLREFYKKLGMKDVKLWPSYFPYTEPSLQVMGYSDIAKDWIELGGSGVFRPEVTRPLGVKVPVLAWGPGIERLMLLRFGLDDLRDLYDGDLKWLRERVEVAGSIS